MARRNSIDPIAESAAPPARTLPPRGWPAARFLLPLAVALAVLAALAYAARPAELATVLLRARWPPLLGALAAMALVIALESYRLRRAFGPGLLSSGASLGLTLRSSCLAQVTPGMVGGEAYKILWMRRLGVSGVKSVVLLATLRGAGLGSLLLLCLAGLPFLGELAWQPGPLSSRSSWLVGGALVLMMIVAVLLLLPEPGAAAAKLKRLLREAWVGLRSLGPGEGARILIASLFVGLARAMGLFFLLWALDEETAFGAVVAASAIASVSGVLPVVPGGLGVQEGALVVVLTAAGVSAPGAVSAALLNRSLQWLAALVGGAGFLFSRRGRGR